MPDSRLVFVKVVSTKAELLNGLSNCTDAIVPMVDVSIIKSAAGIVVVILRKLGVEKLQCVEPNALDV